MISKPERQRPVVTVITPSFNQGKYIKRTIESVLSQGVSDIEYLIYDAGSSDETIAVLQSYGDLIRWVSEPDKGQADAVNKGLIAAGGEIIGWLNSDDIYYPGALRSVIDTFDKYPDIHILYGMADHIDDFDKVIDPYYNEEWNYEHLKEICFVCQPAVFFRKSVVEMFGLLDENLRYCMDYEYWLRIGRSEPFYFLRKKLAGSRLYRETKTLGSAVEVHEEILRMFKNKFGKIPARWIYNHAHIVVREAGLTRESREENLKFVNKLISVAIWDFMRLQHHVPFAALKTIIGWYVEARIRRG
jgi:glycosyltransferase involved in cell wall biosynthesis